MDEEATFVVVGGGIAGVTCAETLAFLEPTEKIIVLSESSLIKTVINLHAITRTLANFDVEEKHFNYLSGKYSNISTIHDQLIEIDHIEHFIITSNSKRIKYQYLCLCTGAVPKMIPQSDEFPEIFGIRDTDSVEKFIEKLQHSKKIVIIGNGGIASELIYKIDNIETHWVIKDKHISATFIDPGAAEFFQSSIINKNQIVNEEPIRKRMRYEEDDFQKSGAALGPDWYQHLIIKGAINQLPPIKIHYECEINNIERLENAEFPLKVILTNNEEICCDLIVSATGVYPKINYKMNNELSRSNDGGINIDEFMETSIKDIYAAGDVCTANWDLAKQWFQMRLWTQARQMGCYAAKSMVGRFKNQQVLQDFCFELFAHSTKLFGYKVILLGLYNGQKLGTNYEILLRMTKGHEYIKFVLVDNKLQGAVLIGDTDLEEMCENLILNQLDLSPYGDDILNPNIDIDDYFD